MLQHDFPGVATFTEVCHHVGAESAVGSTSADGAKYDSHTICGYREECEELCREDENCAGVLMHEFLPRCYLTKATGDVCETSSPDNSYDFLSVGQGPVSYRTESNAICELDTRIRIDHLPVTNIFYLNSKILNNYSETNSSFIQKCIDCIFLFCIRFPCKMGCDVPRQASLIRLIVSVEPEPN